jgi:hypothetical protein
VPQEKPEVGVQDSLVAGAVPVQLLLATVVPSERMQLTVCVAWPELAVTVQEAERVCAVVPQPVVGDQVP